MLRSYFNRLPRRVLVAVCAAAAAAAAAAGLLLTDLMLPVAALNAWKGREGLWNKAGAAVQYAWGEQLLQRNECLLEEDDSYVMVDSPRQLVSHAPVRKLLAAWEDNTGGGGAMFADGGDAGSSRDPDFRFQASLWWDRGEAPLCGAAVIDARNLLTAAHCLFDGVMRPTRRPTNFLRVTAGSADYQKAASYEVAYTYTPYSYDTLGVDNDVAVIRLKKPMQLGEGVRSLPLGSSPPAPGSVCQLSGWGAWANRGDSNATTLRHVEVVVEAPGRCGAATLICVAPNNGGAYTHADDGGPLTCSGRLAGVVVRSGRGGLVVAATDVSRHLGFVADAVSHPGQDAWPFASSVMAGCCVAAACLTVTALLARVADARAAR